MIRYLGIKEHGVCQSLIDGSGEKKVYIEKRE